MLPYTTASLFGIGGRLRVEPEDFVVDEIPAFEASGEGEHLLLRVEKRDTSHDQLVQHLARRLGVSRRQIGVAGMKDRRAVTRQFVSVPATAEGHLADVETNSIHILQSHRHRHKLRTGHLRGNQFSVLVRDTEANAGQAAAQIQQCIGDTGVPNYFGSQRFGHQGETLRQGLELVTGHLRAERLPRQRREFLLRLSLSAVQSELFNQVLAQRIQAGLSRTVLPGDVMQVVVSGGPFVVEDAPAEQMRFDEGETVIAGPLFGPKMLSASGEPGQREQSILEANGLCQQDFERFPRLTRGTRRANWVQLEGLQICEQSDGLRFEFSLAPGCYATVVLREFMKVDDGPRDTG